MVRDHSIYNEEYHVDASIVPEKGLYMIKGEVAISLGKSLIFTYSFQVFIESLLHDRHCSWH